MNKYSLVLFDLDGTFADTSHDMVNALNRLRLAESMTALPYEDLRAHVSGGTPALIRLGFGLSQQDSAYENFRKQFLATYEANICNDTVLFPGMDRILNRCEETGMKWGIVTNKPEHLTLQLLDQMNVTGAACVIGGDSLPFRKPRPEPVVHACSIAGVTPSATVFVGDAERDVQSGNAAGTVTIAVTYGFIPQEEDPTTWGADVLIDTVEEIHNYLWS